MKCFTIQGGQALQYGFEARVHAFAQDHNIAIDSQETYQRIASLLDAQEELPRMRIKVEEAQARLEGMQRKIERLRRELSLPEEP